MSGAPQIFDKNLLQLHLARANRGGNFLVDEAQKLLDERLEYVKRDFADVYAPTRFDEILPEGDAKFDLIKSSLELHFINDLVGVLAQSMRLLRPDGLFLVNMFGGETLQELREVFALAAPDELSPRVSPFVDVKDAGGLLQRTGFALPVVDSENIEIVFDNAFHLMRFLREIGESNALAKQRKNFTGKEFMSRVAEIYADKFSADGGVLATFEIITLTGWKPAPNTPKALERGSGKVNLGDVL